MRVLVACEFSGTVRDAFNKVEGVEAWSCDLLPCESNKDGFHYQGDVRNILKWGWDLMVAHPPCQYLSSSGARWWKQREKEQKKALEFVRLLLEAPIPRICLENPVGAISTYIRKPDQYIQPWQFGENASKKTGLWLKNLPLLIPTKIIKPDFRYGVYSNQTVSGQNKWGSTKKHRDKLRSIFYRGIAEAMATQWTN